jgi:hypothetical protein
MKKVILEKYSICNYRSSHYIPHAITEKYESLKTNSIMNFRCVFYTAFLFEFFSISDLI